MIWNYRIIRRPLNDGAVYGLVEVYYKNDEPIGWSESSYWIEQDPSFFKERIEEYMGGDADPGEWADEYLDSELMDVLRRMKRACEMPVLDEDKMLGEGHA